MSADVSSAGASDTPPPSLPSDWNPTREEFQKQFLEKNRESIAVGATIAGVRMTAQKLLLALQLRSRPGATPEEKLTMEQQSQAIVDKYIDDLAATMQERLQMEGKQVREAYLKLVAHVQELLPQVDNLHFTENDRQTLRTIIEHFSDPEHPLSEDGKTYLGRWMNRDATDGKLVQVDYPAFQKIRDAYSNAPDPSLERQFLEKLYGNLRQLREMDPTNLTFMKSTPTIGPAGRFIANLLLGGIGMYSLLMTWKSGRMPKKGLIALGLLYYINSNGDSRLAFLSSPRYETLTKTLRGTEEGSEVLKALGEKDNRTALKDFALREENRMTLPPGQGDALPSREKSYATLIEVLDIKEKAATLIKGKDPTDITELATILQKCTEEELDVIVLLARRAITPADVAQLEGTRWGC